MRHFNMLAAIAATLLSGGAVAAKAQPDQPKPRRICRVVEEPGRITPRKICRTLPPSEAATNDERAKAGDSREAGNSRD